MASKIYILRHGETAWSLNGQYTGSTDIPLTANGEQRACQLANLLRGTAFSEVLTSPLQRAQRTCELAGFGPVSQVEPAITEWACGDYEGRTPTDIFLERPGWNLFEQGCPAGESPEQISHRADLVIARLRSVEGNVALFSHSHFLRAMAVRWIGLPVGEGRHLVLSTGSLSILSQESNNPEEPAISLWNAVTNELFDLVPRQPSIENGQVSLPWNDNHEN